MKTVRGDTLIPQELSVSVALSKRLERIWSVTADDSETFSDHTIAYLLSRFAWSRIIEPGDAVAGSIIHELGSTEAISLVISDPSGEQLVQALACEGSDVSAKQVYQSCAKWRLRLSRTDTERDITTASHMGFGVLLPNTKYWPIRLNDLGHHAPVMIWSKGNHLSLTGQSLSVVGARAVSGYGSNVTSELVHAAVELGSTIVSGAAYGVDAIAHRTALFLQAPTVAVVAGGIDRCYPAAHSSLLAEISRNGVVCAENAPGTAPTRWRFLMRNRLIAALSVATLVTEAGKRSGSLNTAGHAAQLGRSLGAVPGQITAAGSQGCHFLLREYNADLITGTEDLPSLMGISADVSCSAPTSGNEHESYQDDRQLSSHARVMDALPLRGKRAGSDIAKHAGITIKEANNVLAELMLLGAVEYQQHPTLGKVWGISKRDLSAKLRRASSS